MNDSELDLAYETDGDPSGPALLLIHGLGGQLIQWPPRLVELLVERGFFVIRFDNRDAGLSPGCEGGTPYTLDDMAADAVRLLGRLGVERAHVAGVSMGGMIAQLIAVNHPDRVLTLTSIMSNLGGADVAPAPPAVMQALLGLGPPADRAGVLEHAVQAVRLVGGGEGLDEDAIRLEVGAAYDRAFNPAGTARQLAAVRRAPSRREALGGVVAPALVIHGVDDHLVVLENGRRTAAALPDARLLELEGMSHNLPAHTLEPIANTIAELALHRHP